MTDATHTEPSYLALDPGDTTGFAFFDERGLLLKMGQFKQDVEMQWLNDNLKPELKAVIIEDYKNYAWKKQKNWSRNTTSKLIGKIEMTCEMRTVPYYLQQANVKSIGYLYAGLGEAPSNHSISHQYDAVAHGTYWLRVNGILQPEE